MAIAPVTRLDHVVLTVADVERTCEFYARVLGMERVTFGDSRIALRFGDQKLNLHVAGREFEPKATLPTPGSADVCFVTTTPIADVVAGLRGLGVPIVEGPVPKTGARAALESVYVRDPDGNLIEIANELPWTASPS